MKNNFDVIIIGAGPAGMSAAIYLKRANVDVLVLEKEAPGGMLNKISKIENYPGYTESDGTTLAFRMYSQLESLGVKLATEEVNCINNKDEYYEVITKNNTYNAKYIILSTGKTPRKLNAKGASDYEDKGISYCVTCDGILYKNKDVVIVGSGTSAINAVNYLKDIVNKIYLISDKETFAVENMPSNLVIKTNSRIKEVQGANNLEKIILDNGEEILVNGLFVCRGNDSSGAYYQNLKLDTNKAGIIINDKMETSLKNVYACGDSVSKTLYQVVNACGEAAVCANEIIMKIKG